MRIRLISICVLLSLATALLFPGCQSEQEGPSFSGYKDIAELATIECYFHNVAEVKNSGEDILFGVAKVGYKKAWFEYRGSVDMGIDVNKVNVSSPDSKGVVTITIPKAQVIGEAKVDKDSFSEVYTDIGPFAKRTAMDNTGAFADAQQQMKEQAENDEVLLRQAKERAKVLLEQYVINVGKAYGKDYSVAFVDVE